MEIKFVGGREVAIIRDITDPRYNRWLMGETRDVPDHDIDVLDAYGLGNRRNAVQAVLNAGEEFVDAATGKNPLFICHVCGGRTESDYFQIGSDVVEYVDADDNRLCVTCFLARHPKHDRYHTDRGLPQGLLQIAHDKRAALPGATAVPELVDPAPANAAPLAGELGQHDEESAHV